MRQTGSNLGRREVGRITLRHPVPNVSHLGGAVDLMKHEPGIFTAQIALNILLQHKPSQQQQAVALNTGIPHAPMFLSLGHPLLHLLQLGVCVGSKEVEACGIPDNAATVKAV